MIDEADVVHLDVNKNMETASIKDKINDKTYLVDNDNDFVKIIKTIKEEIGFCLDEVFDYITVTGLTVNELQDLYAKTFYDLDQSFITHMGFKDTKYVLREKGNEMILSGGGSLRTIKKYIEVKTGKKIESLQRLENNIQILCNGTEYIATVL